MCILSIVDCPSYFPYIQKKQMLLVNTVKQLT